MDASTSEHVVDDAAAPVGGEEGGATALVERVGALETELRRTREALRAAERRSLVHRALMGSGAVDVDAVALVVEAAMDNGASTDAPGVSRVVDEVRRTRPALFKGAGAGASRSTAMTARVERAVTRTPLEEAAHRAARAGDRTSLLHYLRLRRAGTA